ncbi:LysR family transcriptional regulator [Mesorhizobium sp. B2-3-10]|uniref:LysR family transcriptional regulator n=1 Tax=Mesorhizobium sp. B2-3-10 TaxID=2589954 RepID=UPI0011296B8F|nr:LysR family transcriptional regulator [Mesorhizobium sp. B2-3-10]TPL96083.1 LysR family transcriptional regulator [Mesorhizobium sp. B2-3-10]
MLNLDLNLLVALDALLRERSVSGAAKKLGLSTSAMSRTLSRLRLALSDPILVSAGRAMVATPHAEAIAEQVHTLTSAVRSVLSPSPEIDISQVRRDFTIRANEAFVLLYAARLHALVTSAAPGIRLRFAPRPDKRIELLREATIDLDIGVLSGDGAELRGQALFEDRFVGVARTGHPLLETEITAERYAACRHVVSSRRGHFIEPIDEALAELGLSRNVDLVVPSYPAVVAVAAASDLVGLVPRSYHLGATGRTQMFDLPVASPGFTITQAWHPRMDADPVHRWLRSLIFKEFPSAVRRLEQPAKAGSLVTDRRRTD